MEPIPETERAFDELDAICTDDDMLNALRRASERVRGIVPACTGLSLALLDHGITLTLVATEEDIQLLDAMQYLDGGPCVKAAEGRRVVMSDTSAMDENGWRLFAAATSAHGVASTLSMPLFEGNAVIGSVNLYAATPHAFDNHHEEVADILGAWAGGAVTNADLSFSTRQDAQRAPQVLDDQRRLDNALGMLSAYTGQSIDEARQRLATAGVTLAAVVDAVIALRGHINL